MNDMAHGQAALGHSRKAKSGFDGNAAEPKADGRAAQSEMHVLLGRILARTELSETPVIQIVPCGPGEHAGDIALGLAIAAATELGRSLLISDANTPKFDGGDEYTGDGGTLPTLRDVFVPALHHAQLGRHLLNRRRTDSRLQTTISDTARAFRLIVLDCKSTSDSPHSLAIAPLCSGTILVVQAGHTPLGAVRSASRDILDAPGRVLGTVLSCQPSGLPSWVSAA